MSSLTGQQINNSYQGLLKLANSSTGITSNFQSIEDGLGNDTGMRIATNQLEVPNMPSTVALKADYYGSGFSATAPQAFASGTQNIILAQPFYDAGKYSYSALTYQVVTATTSSDSVEVSFYSTQMINPSGLFPKDKLVTEFSLTGLTTTGSKTIIFPSPLSFSGFGGGLFFVVYKISNSGVAPTVRFGQAVQTQSSLSPIYFPQYGNIITLANSIGGGPRYNGQFMSFSGASTFDATFTTSIASAQSTTQNINGPGFGFALHTI